MPLSRLGRSRTVVQSYAVGAFFGLMSANDAAKTFLIPSSRRPPFGRASAGVAALVLSLIKE